MICIKKRQEIERKVVRHLIETMDKHGWKVLYIDDGGDLDEYVNPTTTDEAMEAVFAVDEATIYFRKQLESNRGKTHCAQIVLGNDGWDAIADHSCGSTHEKDDFEKIMKEEVDPYCDKLEEEA